MNESILYKRKKDVVSLRAVFEEERLSFHCYINCKDTSAGCIDINLNAIYMRTQLELRPPMNIINKQIYAIEI